jgi:hypothetical protein
MEPGATTSKSDEIGLNIIEFEAVMRHSAFKVNRNVGPAEMPYKLTGLITEQDARLFAHQNRKR